MIQFSTAILQFEKKGEKTGWSYIEITAAQAQQLKRGYRVSFRVTGKLDNYNFQKVALLPMGKGDFILPINGKIRKAIGKRRGDTINVVMQADKREPSLSKDLMKCLRDDQDARSFFNSLPKSHQRYISNWIDSAKTTQTRTKRIAMAIIALSKKQGFGEMLRANKNNAYQV